MTSPADIADAIRAYNEGVRAMQAGDSDAAAAAWTRAVELDPGMTPALRNLVVFYEERDRLAEVVQAYDAILAFDPFDTEALIRQASAYRRTGNSSAAIANYEKAIAIYPYFRFWYAELATIYDQIGETDTGELWRERAMQLDSDEAEMAFEDGVRQQRAGNTDLAVAIFEAVIEDQPANLEARVRLASLLASTGRGEEAREQLDMAFEMTDAAPALVLYHRARLRSAAGDLDGAADDLRAAIDDEPTFGRARRLLERIEGTKGEGPPGKSADIPPVADTVGVASGEGSISQLEALAPRLDAPNPDDDWLEQLRFVVAQAADLESRTGRPGRVAILLDADVRLVPASNAVLHLVTDPELGLVTDDDSRVYVIEGEAHTGASRHGVIDEGWLGKDYHGPHHDQWSAECEGLVLDRMLEAAQLAVGSDGFNLVLIVAGGRIRADQTHTLSFARHVPTYQYAVVTTPSHDTDLHDRLAGHVPNLVTVVAAH